MPDREADMAQLSCHHCERKFARREHLTRHLRRHSGARPHACPQCGKSFSRRDTLKRHVNGHGEGAMTDFVQQHARTRACASCARAKQRCDGGRPCSGCQDRNKASECHYTLLSALPPPPLATPSQADTSMDPDWTVDMTAESTDGLLAIPADPVSLDPGLPAWDQSMLDIDLPFWSGMMMGGNSDISGVPCNSHPHDGGAGLEELDSLHAEDHRHVDSIPAATYDRIMRYAYVDETGVDDWKAKCPPLHCFAVYVQLYFEHHHPRMPFLHLPTFNVGIDNWACVLAVACIGSHYSAHAQHVQHWRWLTRATTRLLQKEMNFVENMNPLRHAQTLLVVCNCLLFGESREALLLFQLHRNNLIVHCRRSLPPAGSLFRGEPHAGSGDGTWSQWVQGEAKRRLLYYTWVTECFQGVFFMLPPLLDAMELQEPLPCSEALWRAPNEARWQGLHRPVSARNIDAMDAPSVHLAIEHISRTGNMPPALSEGAAMVVVLTCFVQHVKIKSLIEAAHPAATPSYALEHSSSPLNVLLTHYESVMRSVLQLASPVSVLEAERTTLAQTLHILVFTPLPLLTQASHWETTAANCGEAQKQIKSLIIAQPSRARQVMLQAARLFHTLRNAAPLSHIDPFSLLVAVLSIEAYIKYATDTQGPEHSPREIYRIDQDPDESKARDWTEARGDNPLLHISGVGVLDTERGQVRLLKEGAKILAARGSSCLAAGLSKILFAQAAGQIPQISQAADTLQQ